MEVWPSRSLSSVSEIKITPEQKSAMEQVVSAFENSTTTLRYDYVENLDDGRGYTAGRCGFTTRDGDLKEVIKAYAVLNPETPLKKFIPVLTMLNRRNSSSVSQLKDLPELWKEASSDPDFKKAQDQVADRLYFLPAMEIVNRLNLQTQLGALCIFDASIQHGTDGDDGVVDMISRMGPLSQYPTEAEFLTAFLKTRRATLLRPKDPGTQAAWQDSVGRVDALQAFVDAGNFELKTPFIITAYGDRFTIGNP